MFTDFYQLLNLDRCVPMSALVGNGNILYGAGNRTTLVKAYPAYLGKEEPAVINLKSLWETYALIQPSLFKHWKALHGLVFIKAIPESPFQILQLLLQYL